MRTVLFVVVAALACQAASAGNLKSLLHGKDSHASKDAYAAKATYHPTPAAPTSYEVQKVEKCRPATIVLSDPAVLACSTGYTLANGTCSATVCKKVMVEAKPAYSAAPAKAAYAPADNKYGFKIFKAIEAKLEDKKAKYEPKAAKPAYTAQEVCTVVTAKPVYTCGKGATLSGDKCITGAKLADCPAGYTADKDVCTKVTVVVVNATESAPAKPTYTAPKASYAPKEASKATYAAPKATYAPKATQEASKGKYGFLSKVVAKHDKYAHKAVESIPACPAAPVTESKPVVVSSKVEYKPAAKPAYQPKKEAVKAKVEKKVEGLKSKVVGLVSKVKGAVSKLFHH